MLVYIYRIIRLTKKVITAAKIQRKLLTCQSKVRKLAAHKTEMKVGRILKSNLYMIIRQ